MQFTAGKYVELNYFTTHSTFKQVASTLSTTCKK